MSLRPVALHSAVHRERGFTLMEVLVAMTILSVGLVAVLQIFGQGMRMTRTAEEMTLATLLARSKMSDTLMQEQMKEKGSDSGTFEEFEGRFSYEVGIEEVELEFLQPKEGLNFDTVSATTSQEPPSFKTYYVTVTVTWNDGRKQVRLESLRTDYEMPEAKK